MGILWFGTSFNEFTILFKKFFKFIYLLYYYIIRNWLLYSKSFKYIIISCYETDSMGLNW